MISQFLQRRLDVKDDIETLDEEDGADAVAGVLDEMFINYARQVRHREARRLWHVNNWGQHVEFSLLSTTLTKTLVVDVAAAELIDDFLSSWSPEEKEDQTISTSIMNEIFPPSAADISIGDWILYRMHEDKWPNLLAYERALNAVNARVDEQVIYAILRGPLFATAECMRSVQTMLREFPILPGHRDTRILRVLDKMIMEGGPIPEGEIDSHYPRLQALADSLSDIKRQTDSKVLCTERVSF
jgi:hypothetical protein